MIRAVIFDFNGVLVDDEPVHFTLLREILAQEGIDLTEREYQDVYLGLDDRGCFEVALAAAGQPADRARVDSLIAQKARRYGVWAEEGLKVFPDATGILSAIADRWPVAICSGALRPEIEFALDLMRVRHRVAVVVSAEDTTRCKPDPEGYLITLDALRSSERAALSDLRAQECLVIEDSLAGVDAARAAGMRTVAVAHTYLVEHLQSAGADAVLGALAQVTPAWINQIDL
jgi:HAD superfamily hydrolase (TIGR01509 family)